MTKYCAYCDAVAIKNQRKYCKACWFEVFIPCPQPNCKGRMQPDKWRTMCNWCYRKMKEEERI